MTEDFKLLNDMGLTPLLGNDFHFMNSNTGMILRTFTDYPPDIYLNGITISLNKTREVAYFAINGIKEFYNLYTVLEDYKNDKLFQRSLVDEHISKIAEVLNALNYDIDELLSKFMNIRRTTLY